MFNGVIHCFLADAEKMRRDILIVDQDLSIRLKPARHMENILYLARQLLQRHHKAVRFR